MEPEILTYPQFERTIRWIAAALGIEQLEAGWEDSKRIGFHGSQGDIEFGLELTHDGELYHLWVGKPGISGGPKSTSDLYLDFPEDLYCDGERKQWFYFSHPAYDAIMARTFYRLGFEDEAVLAQLPPLSAHEKVELRLSMPREFWPKKWLDEEANS